MGRNRTKPALSVKNGGGEETKRRRERKERGKGQNDEMRYREGKWDRKRWEERMGNKGHEESKTGE